MAKRNQWTRFARSPNLSEGAFSKNLPIASIVPKDSVEACRHASETDWNYVIEAKRCLVIRAISGAGYPDRLPVAGHFSTENYGRGRASVIAQLEHIQDLRQEPMSKMCQWPTR
jgi:hypothetical protein